jgi:hypothetical protein
VLDVLENQPNKDPLGKLAHIAAWLPAGSDDAARWKQVTNYTGATTKPNLQWVRVYEDLDQCIRALNETRYTEAVAYAERIIANPSAGYQTCRAYFLECRALLKLARDDSAREAFAAGDAQFQRLDSRMFWMSSLWKDCRDERDRAISAMPDAAARTATTMPTSSTRPTASRPCSP